MRERLCKVCGGWHSVEDWPDACHIEAESKRAAMPTPMFSSDTMKPLQSMENGKMYDSRSEMLKHYRESGVRIVEKGERRTPPPPKTSRAEVVAAMKRAGMI